MIDKSFWAGRRVLLTGHTGFKGSWLLLWLLRLGSEVWGYSLPPQGPKSLFQQLTFEDSNFHHQTGDLMDIATLKKVIIQSRPEVVFHLAAQSLVRRSYREPLSTWATNVQGSLCLLEALKDLDSPCAVVMVTTDKVYQNREWNYGYREDDRLGGHDPYSASKAAAELAISSWRSSFVGKFPHQNPYLAIATARAGNVIGGGDWAEERIIPDVINSLAAGKSIPVRSPRSTRPWQHVLEPLSGYLLLAERLFADNLSYSSSYNFGPFLDANRSVMELVKEVLRSWPGEWEDLSDLSSPHEAGKLHLQIDKAYHLLSWRPQWDFRMTVSRTVDWYRAVFEGASPIECCTADLDFYERGDSCL